MTTSVPAPRPAGVELGWAAFSLAMLVQMWLTPNDMTTPYHLMWVATILIYGFRLWPPRVFFPVLTLLAVITGMLFLRPFLSGRLGLDEMSEVPLMPLIVGLGAWHAWRRSQAQRQVEELAELEGSRLVRQREFLRDASHAIRTPVTIARGHVELLAMRTDDEQVASDAAEVLHQLDRLTHLAGRLLMIEQLATAQALDAEPLDVRRFLEAVGRRWSTAAPRRWVVDVEPTGAVLADVRRLEEAVDALVENALRFTDEGDVIRLSARPDGDTAVLEVADSGPGIPVVDRHRVFERFFQRHPRGEEPGTGLGLALVAAVAAAHQGTVGVDVAREGGASLSLRLPLHAATGVQVPRLVPPDPPFAPQPDPA
jgi:signal transduction histidine kinase